MTTRLRLLLLLALVGCGQRDFLVVNGYRDAVIARQHPAQITDAEVRTIKQRNQIINDGLFLIDLEFYSFVTSLHEEQATWETAGDFVEIGLTTGATLAGLAGTKTVLAAIATAIKAGREVVSSNYFVDANRYALIARMRASRAAVLARIEAGKRRPVRDYPISQAVVDLVAYVHAGTLINAVQAIAEQSTEALRVERGNLDSVRQKSVPAEEDAQ